ncbi:MAG: hypothetical protein ACLP6G_23995 [Terriglobales bacterium]
MLQDLVPFLVVGVGFLIAFFVFCRFAQRPKTRRIVRNPGPVADLENHHAVSREIPAHPELDPQLASLFIYPGAVPVRESPAELPGTQHRGEVSTTYWTPDPIEVVWEHYRRQLPDWAETLSEDTSRELLYRTDHHSCLIRVYGKDGRTLIEATVKPAQYNRNNLFSQN